MAADPIEIPGVWCVTQTIPAVYSMAPPTAARTMDDVSDMDLVVDMDTLQEST